MARPSSRIPPLSLTNRVDASPESHVEARWREGAGTATTNPVRDVRAEIPMADLDREKGIPTPRAP